MTSQPAPGARVLDTSKVVETVEKLRARIAERFPGSGLSSVCGSLAAAARLTAAREAELARPILPFRLLAVVVVIAAVAVQIYVGVLMDWGRILVREDPVQVAQGINSIVNLLLLAFGAIWFVLTLEQRWKRRRVLAHLYEFRSLAHIVDMHQLTKDPTVVLGAGTDTADSPKRHMSEFELSRYLEYCSEMLALIAKLAAIYAGRTQDREVAAAVNEIEDLTSNLGRKIWQKSMIASQLVERRAAETKGMLDPSAAPL
ncbi:MAG TPA: hypothetical protein VGI20_07630 [Rhizomicrobium sp.]